MNVNFIRTGVLISMNLDPEGVIAAAGSTYIRRHTHTHTHIHINTYILHINITCTLGVIFFLLIRPETASVASYYACVHHLLSARRISDRIPSLAGRQPLGNLGRPSY